MEVIVGYTGFVGSNLQRQHKFDRVFNSKNIADAFGVNPDLCVYAGIRSEKFVADKFPENDLKHVKEAIENIRQICPKRLVLISTVDVIPSPQTTDIYEDTLYQTDRLTPYGQNRLFLENEVRRLYPDTLIVRLPALFGKGMKKNFIYDLVSFVPALLKKTKFEGFCLEIEELNNFYKEDENGFFRLKPSISDSGLAKLKSMFESLGFSALNFTDSRSKFAFYNLEYLWVHIETLLNDGATLVHMATAPVSAAEIYFALYGEIFKNEIIPQPFDYTFFKTRHTKVLGGKDGYIFDKYETVSDIVNFVNHVI